MKIEKSTIKSEAVFSDDHKFRYLLHREWIRERRHAMVLSISPSSQVGATTDLTTMLITTNVNKADYGGFSLVNLISAVDVEAKKLKSTNGLIGDDTDKYITEAAKASDIIILAYGKIAAVNKAFAERETEVLKLLEPYANKLHFITDVMGREMLHPLTPSIRNSWLLQPYHSADSKK